MEGIVKRYTNALTLAEGQGLGTMVEGIVKRYTNALTSAEGQGLGPMVEGIVKRYTGVSPPEVLYVDRDCRETRAYAGCLHSGLTWTYALTYGTSCVVSVPVVPQTPTRCTECSCLATPSASSCLLSIYSRSY